VRRKTHVNIFFEISRGALMARNRQRNDEVVMINFFHPAKAEHVFSANGAALTSKPWGSVPGFVK
jgi:hypothetical protein